MFIQTVIQTLLRKRKKVESAPKPTASTAQNELSPMAQRIMQKLAEHEKNSSLGQKSADDKEKSGTTSDS